ncbi:MAG: urease accessory protein UreF [Cypionkella sp.]|jgi:urease accessory protein|nr:urease accessory protein UreF [Cypionkella sp.]
MTAGLLTLVQWLSPAFPTGGFAYSHGLEQAIAAGEVADAPALRHWLSDVLAFGAGRQDAVLLVQALGPEADHGALDDLARALQPSAERLTETLDQGAAFARTVAAMTGRDLPARCLPVAVGEAAAALDLPVAQVVALYLHSFASNLTSVAMRFMPLGQVAGQGVLASLHPQIEALAQEAAHLTLDDLGSAALGADLAAMRHETMDVRIFRT